MSTFPRTPASLCTVLAVLFLALSIPTEAASKFKVIHQFDTHDGLYPVAPLVEDAAGNFYGTTEAGGDRDRGTVFKIAVGTNTESVIYSFKGGKDGALPEAGLVVDSQGNLYGTTSTGGIGTCYYDTCGIVFELSPTAQGWTETIIHSFRGGHDGGNPTCSLLLDSSGNLYGVTSNGGKYSAGTVFELSNSSGTWQKSILHSFGGNSDTSQPMNGLVMDANSNIFGAAGGGYGAIFELSPAKTGWTEQVIYSFTGNDGVQPWGVVLDAKGNLFGSTTFSAYNRPGTVFELSQSGGSWHETTLYRFTGGTDGGVLRSGVTLDAAGNVYGTTVEGGAPDCDSGGYGKLGCGVVYMVTPSGNETVLYTFAGRDRGANPSATVIFDSSGRLWGTTQLNGPGGFFGAGVVFNLTPQNNGTWTETVVHGFADRKDGFRSNSRLIENAAGNLYGTTTGGGSHNSGTVFELAPSGNDWKQHILYSFKNGKDGAYPLAGLIFDANGNLYGTTEYGGGAGRCYWQTGPIYCGTVFELTHQPNGSWSESVLHSFSGKADGSFPISGLVMDAGGNVFGTTYKGGSKNAGAVFEVSPTGSGWTETVISNIGGNPVGTLTIDPDGNLYGTTSGSIQHKNCKVFELIRGQSGWTEKVLHAFTGAPGDLFLPFAGVVFDSKGNLFGSAVEGGIYNAGGVFELVPDKNSNWRETILFNWVGTDDGPVDATDVIVSEDETIYGTTEGGGKVTGGICQSVGCGTVYELKKTQGSWQQTGLYEFQGDNDGAFPDAGVLLGSDGNLYGTTSYGGANPELGNVYSVMP